jgi:hypothetical protein
MEESEEAGGAEASGLLLRGHGDDDGRAGEEEQRCVVEAQAEGIGTEKVRRQPVQQVGAGQIDVEQGPVRREAVGQGKRDVAEQRCVVDHLPVEGGRQQQRDEGCEPESEEASCQHKNV